MSEARHGSRQAGQSGGYCRDWARDDVQLDSDVARRVGKMWMNLRNMLELEWRSLVMDHL